MYTIDRERRGTKSPVISSLTSANHRLNHWLQENGYHRVKDADGLVWRMTIKDHLIPDPLGSKRGILKIKVDITASCNIEMLIDTETLKQPEDCRLIHLIGEESVTLNMKPIFFQAATIEEARQTLYKNITQIRHRLQSTSLHTIKRNLIGRWVDHSRLFL